MPNNPNTSELHLPNRRPPKEGWRSILYTVAVFVAAIGFSVILVLYIFQQYQVEGSSMEPTLQNSDRLVIWKVPRTWARITGNSYTPDRGDVVVFAAPTGSAGTSSGKQLIKRVIGLPGERLIIKDGVVTVFNEQNPKGLTPYLSYGQDIGLSFYDVDVDIPRDSFFALGDNRNNSLDSRTFGPIKLDSIVGKLSFRFFPINKFDSF